MAPPLRGRFQAVVRIAGDLSSPRRRRMAACSAGGLHRAVTRAASSRMRRMLLLQCVAAAPASRSPHLWRTTPIAAATPAGLSPPLAREAALGAVLQPLIERSVAARALAMNASPQPLRHAAVTAATGRVARLSTKINPMRSTASTRFPLLLRSLIGLTEEQSGSARLAGWRKDSRGWCSVFSSGCFWTIRPHDWPRQA